MHARTHIHIHACIPGYFIFGHQYSGMQTFDKSISTLFFMMMNFDPSQFWLQMMGSTCTHTHTHSLTYLCPHTM